MDWKYCMCLTPLKEWDQYEWGESAEPAAQPTTQVNLDHTPESTLPGDLSEKFTDVMDEVHQVKNVLAQCEYAHESDRVERLMRERTEWWNEVLKAATQVGHFSKQTNMHPQVVWAGGKAYLMHKEQ